jgi:polysaccharide biosynthesis/export protein
MTNEGTTTMTVRGCTWPMFVLGLIAATLAQPAAQTPARPAAPPPTASPAGQRPTAPQTPAPRQTGPSMASTGSPVPSDYVIGPDDVLNIVFWRDADMTQQVTVRPDGNITLPLIGDIKAAGLPPAELKDIITKAAAKFIEDPNVTVVVSQINSRNVFVTGGVARPGPYPISGQMTVVQILAVAGGLTEFADAKNVRIMRVENGQTRQYKFNYNEFMDGKNLDQNILLKPGDTVMVKQ